MSVSDLTKTWTDALTTMSVGSLSFILPFVTEVDADGSLRFAFGKVSEITQPIENGSATFSLLAALFFVGLSLLVGSWLMQVGEFISILPDRRYGRSRIVKRIREAEKNPALLMIFHSAHAAFRLFCGFGALLAWFGGFLIVIGVRDASLQSAAIGFFLISCGLLSCLLWARWSFTYLDWIVSDDDWF